MNKIIKSICLLILLFSFNAYSQNLWCSSLNFGIVIPSGILSNYYSTGIEFGSIIITPSSHKILRFAGGILYSYYPGGIFEPSTRAVTVGGGVGPTTKETYYDNSSILKLFLGPKIEFRQFYILPNLAGNFSGDSFRLGFDSVAGFLFPIGKKFYIDLSGRYEFQNLIGKEEGELTVSAVHFGIGIGYKF